MRVESFQLESLTQIAKTALRSLPRYAAKPAHGKGKKSSGAEQPTLELFIPGSISNYKWGLKKPHTLYASPNNPGAAAVARRIAAFATSGALTVPTDDELGDWSRAILAKLPSVSLREPITPRTPREGSVRRSAHRGSSRFIASSSANKSGRFSPTSMLSSTRQTGSGFRVDLGLRQASSRQRRPMAAEHRDAAATHLQAAARGRALRRANVPRLLAGRSASFLGSKFLPPTSKRDASPTAVRVTVEPQAASASAADADAVPVVARQSAWLADKEAEATADAVAIEIAQDGRGRALSPSRSMLDLPVFGDEQASHFLLYLNVNTFEGQAGDRLADELRFLLGLPGGGRAGRVPPDQMVKVIMIHERDEAAGGCDFDRFLHVTPRDLVMGGLYKPVAVWHFPGPHERISWAETCKSMGLDKTMKKRKQEQQAAKVPPPSPVGAPAEGFVESPVSPRGDHRASGGQ